VATSMIVFLMPWLRGLPAPCWPNQNSKRAPAEVLLDAVAFSRGARGCSFTVNQWFAD
jgi:hypothetical protein